MAEWSVKAPPAPQDEVLRIEGASVKVVYRPLADLEGREVVIVLPDLSDST